MKTQRNSRWRQIAASNKRSNDHSGDLGYIDLNRWKIRGWRRRVKHVNHWGRSILVPYLAAWNQEKAYTHERYTRYPWYRFYKHRQPPIWFFKKILEQFLWTFDNWEKIFKKRNEPYDLFLAIHDPNFILSEIECNRAKTFGDKYTYWPLSKIQKPFPFEKFKLNSCDLNTFDWELLIEEDYIFESEFEYRSTNEEALLKKGFVKLKHSNGEAYYAKAVGDIWIGRKKNKG